MDGKRTLGLFDWHAGFKHERRWHRKQRATDAFLAEGVRRGVDGVLFGGDVTHDPPVDLKWVRMEVEWLLGRCEEIRNEGVWLGALPGNHDTEERFSLVAESGVVQRVPPAVLRSDVVWVHGDFFGTSREKHLVRLLGDERAIRELEDLRVPEEELRWMGISFASLERVEQALSYVAAETLCEEIYSHYIGFRAQMARLLRGHWRRKHARRTMKQALNHYSIECACTLAKDTGARGAVFGHTHRYGIEQVDGIPVGNGGSFISGRRPRCCFVDESEGVMELWKFTKLGKVRVEKEAPLSESVRLQASA